MTEANSGHIFSAGIGAILSEALQDNERRRTGDAGSGNETPLPTPLSLSSILDEMILGNNAQAPLLERSLSDGGLETSFSSEKFRHWFAENPSIGCFFDHRKSSASAAAADRTLLRLVHSKVLIADMPPPSSGQFTSRTQFQFDEKVVKEFVSDARMDTERERRVFAAAVAHELMGDRGSELALSQELMDDFELVPRAEETLAADPGAGKGSTQIATEVSAQPVISTDVADDADENCSEMSPTSELQNLSSVPTPLDVPTPRDVIQIENLTQAGVGDSAEASSAPITPAFDETLDTPEKNLDTSNSDLEGQPGMVRRSLGDVVDIREELEAALRHIQKVSIRLPGDVDCANAEEHVFRAMSSLDQNSAGDSHNHQPASAGKTRIDAILSRIDAWDIHTQDRNDRIRASLATVNDSIASDAIIEEFVRRHVPRKGTNLSPLRSVVMIQRFFRARKVRAAASRWQSLVAQWRDHSASKPLRNRVAAVNELIATEKNYVRGLSVLCDDYAPGLSAAAGSVSAQDAALVFSNVELLRRCHETMLVELIAGNCPGKSIAHGFVLLAPFLKIYTQYVNSYEGALTALERMKHVPAFQTALQETQRRVCEKEASFGLENLLIAPIQRMPRYNLLLQEIIKLTPPGHQDRTALEEALTHIRGVNSHINEHKKRMENLERVLQIQRKLTFAYGGGGGFAGAVAGEVAAAGAPQQITGAGTAEMMIVEPHRIWVREGFLQLSRSNAPPESPRAEFYCFLFNDIFVYTHVEESWAEWASSSRASTRVSLAPAGDALLSPTTTRVHRAPNVREQKAQPQSFQFRGFFSLDTVSIEHCFPRLSADAYPSSGVQGDLDDGMLRTVHENFSFRFSCARCGRETITVEKPSPTHFLSIDRFAAEWKDFVGLRGSCSRQSCPGEQDALCTFVNKEDHSAIASMNCATATLESVSLLLSSFVKEVDETSVPVVDVAGDPRAIPDRITVAPADVDRCFVLKHTPRVIDQTPSKMVVYCKDAQECLDWTEALRENISSRCRPEAIANPLVGGDHLKRVLCDGWLAKQGAWIATWRRRFFRLRGNTLFYYVNANEAANPDPRGFVSLDRYSLALPAQLELGGGLHEADRSAPTAAEPSARKSRLSRTQSALLDSTIVGPTIDTIDQLFSGLWTAPTFYFHLVHEEPDRRRYIMIADTKAEYLKWTKALREIIPVIEL